MEDRNNIVLSADVGGSHITTALVDLNTRQIIDETFVRARVDSQGSTGTIISSWASAINETLRLGNVSVNHFGLAMPGPFDYANGISKMKDNAKFEALYNLNVKDILAAALSIQPFQIKLMNDAGCFLQGEVFGGAAQHFKRAIGITLGTGLGSAKYNHGIAEDAEMWCKPFKNSIAEDYISTRWFVSRYKQVTGKEIQDVKALVSLADADGVVSNIFEEFGENLALFLREFIAQEDPEVLILSGNIANAFSLFEKSLRNNLPEIVIKISALGESAALLGAGSLWDLVYHEN